MITASKHPDLETVGSLLEANRLPVSDLSHLNLEYFVVLNQTDPEADAYISESQRSVDQSFTDKGLNKGSKVSVKSRAVAVAGVEAFGENGLLRSVAVAPECQGQGLGHVLMDEIESLSTDLGIAKLYLLTDTAESFFSKLGFQHTARERAPSSISSTREFSSICPASAAFMCKAI